MLPKVLLLMKITEILLARTVWFVDLQKLNPEGLAYGSIYSSLKERYKFLRYPTTPSEIDLNKGTLFGGGEFDYEGKKIGVGITVYNNGWAADSLVSTESSEAFLEDISAWLTDTVGLLQAKNFVTKIIYDSQLVLHSELDLKKLCAKLKSFSSIVGKASGNPIEEVAGFTIGSGKYPYATFAVERRNNVEFSEMKYFSKASVPTSKHIYLLEEFEKLLG
jgi:hypothetical protein